MICVHAAGMKMQPSPAVILIRTLEFPQILQPVICV